MSVDPKKFGITPSLVDAVKLTLEGKSLAALAPPRDKVTHKDVLVGRGVLKKHPQDPDKHVVAKEEAEQVDELSDKTLQSYREKSHKDKKPREYGRAMAFAKQTGIGAKVKATKEEAEQVDEISDKVKQSYIKKAGKQVDKSASVLFNPNNKYTGKDKYAAHDVRYHKRLSGIEKAKSSMKEEAEQVDEISSDLAQRYRTKALAHKSKVSPDNPYSSPEHKAAIRQDRNRSQGKQLSWMKMTGQGMGGKALKVPATRKATTEEAVTEDAEKVNRATGAAAAAAIRSADPVISKMKDSNPQMHKALTKTTNPGNIFTGSRYGDKGVAEANGSSNPSTSSSALDKINSIATDMKKMASEPLKAPKDPGAVKKLPNVNAPGAPDMFKTEAVADPMAAKKAEVQKKIAQKQATAVQARANKRMSNINASNDKCSCDSTNESKMKCEVHGDSGMKGGKEKIQVNPPLREAEDLPKKVITKGHEIAKSLIKNRAKVREPYAVGMAQAKKSAGIKD